VDVIAAFSELGEQAGERTARLAIRDDDHAVAVFGVARPKDDFVPCNPVRVVVEVDLKALVGKLELELAFHRFAVRLTPRSAARTARSAGIVRCNGLFDRDGVSPGDASAATGACSSLAQGVCDRRRSPTS
jgi:hypothetical protein